MTDIEFSPRIYYESRMTYYGIEARWQSKDARRKVFASWNDGKSYVHLLGSISNDTPDYSAQAFAKAKHVADTLNRWIDKHSEQELNEVLGLIERENTANLTHDQNALLAEYQLLE